MNTYTVILDYNEEHKYTCDSIATLADCIFNDDNYNQDSIVLIKIVKEPSDKDSSYHQTPNHIPNQ